VKLDDDVQLASLDVSAIGTYISPTSARYGTPVGTEVLTGKLAVTGLALDSTRRISIRWNFKPVTECIDALLKAVGGEISFDASNRVMYHDERQGWTNP